MRRTSPIRFSVAVTRELLLWGAVIAASGIWMNLAQAGQDDPNGPATVPEINLGMAGGALTLLSGGLILLRDRLRSYKATE